MRVEIRTPKLSDAAAYAAAMRRSAEHVGRWNPVEPDGLVDLVRRQGEGLHSFLILNIEDGGLVGTCNVANVVRGRFLNATLGYNSYLPYNGTGRMTEGMRLVVDRCFTPEPKGGLGTAPAGDQLPAGERPLAGHGQAPGLPARGFLAPDALPAGRLAGP
jgi:ribosomal-protein-alanine N-acetyltransferase